MDSGTFKSHAAKGGLGMALAVPWALVGHLSMQLADVRVEIGQVRTELSAIKVDIGHLQGSARARLETTTKSADELERKASDAAKQVASLARCYNDNHRRKCQFGDAGGR